MTVAGRQNPSHGADGRRAFLTLEVLGSLGFVIALAALLSVVTLQYAAARRENDARRMLRQVAAGELERMRAGLAPVAASDRTLPTTQPAATRLTITTRPGEGPWRGLTEVRIVASRAITGTRTVRVELAAYLAASETGP